MSAFNKHDLNEISLNIIRFYITLKLRGIKWLDVFSLNIIRFYTTLKPVLIYTLLINSLNIIRFYTTLKPNQTKPNYIKIIVLIISCKLML